MIANGKNYVYVISIDHDKALEKGIGGIVNGIVGIYETLELAKQKRDEFYEETDIIAEINEFLVFE